MITAILNVITGGLFKTVTDLGQAYFNKEISREDFESRIAIAQSEAQKAIEVAWAQASAQMTESAQATVRASPVIQRAYAGVMFIEVAILAWFQIGTSAYEILTGTPWPTPIINVDYAYLLVAATLGAGPFVFRK